MDREYMLNYCKLVHDDLLSDASSEDPDAYRQMTKEVNELNVKMEQAINSAGDQGKRLYEKWQTLCVRRENFLMEQVYLLGAEDREHMLR